MTRADADAPHTCPTCGQPFETRRGLGVHHSAVHDERLPNRECAHCGGAFYSEYEKKYCSEACLSTAAPYAGDQNPNYRGGKEQTICRICGRPLEYYPSEKRGLYCPECVETEQWRTVPVIRGSDHPRWSGGKQRHSCVVCGDIVERYPSNASDVVTCSDDCQRSWLSERFTGDGHPNWRGGGNPAYGTGWAAVRSKALDRDDHQCVYCGLTRDELGRNPDVHHLIPVRWYLETDGFEVEDAHFLENVVSLCSSCHRKAEFGTLDTEDLRKLIARE